MMGIRKTLLLCLFMVCLTSVHSEELLKTTSTWEGGEIAYPEGKPEITSFKLKIAAGEISKFHCHPVPTLGYILEGDVEVETKSGKKTILKEGESAVEVFRTVHRGRAVGGPVEIVVFYAGATNVPNTVLPENDPEHIYCNE